MTTEYFPITWLAIGIFVGWIVGICSCAVMLEVTKAQLKRIERFNIEVRKDLLKIETLHKEVSENAEEFLFKLTNVISKPRERVGIDHEL